MGFCGCLPQIKYVYKVFFVWVSLLISFYRKLKRILFRKLLEWNNAMLILQRILSFRSLFSEYTFASRQKCGFVFFLLRTKWRYSIKMDKISFDKSFHGKNFVILLYENVDCWDKAVRRILFFVVAFFFWS